MMFRCVLPLFLVCFGVHAAWNSKTDCDDDWQLIFRAQAGNGQYTYNTWVASTPNPCTVANGCIPENVDISMMKIPTNKHLRSPVIRKWSTSNIKKIKLELFENGKSVMYMIFDGKNTNYVSWFNSKYLLESSYDDLYSDGCFNKFYFTSWYAYSFMTHQDGHNCDSNSRGWLSVVDYLYTSSYSYASTCSRMRFTSAYPIFTYAKNNHKTRWADNKFGKADILAVYVQRA